MIMPRQYKRKTDHGLASHDIMLQGVQLVIGGMPVRKAAEQQGVSKSALCRYVMKYRGNPAVVLTPNYRHSQVFSMEQEDTLAEYLDTSSQMFHGLTPKLVRKLAYEMVCINKLHMPKKWAEEKQAGEDWFSGFLRRHQTLSIRSPEATSLARATSFNKHNVKAYFDILEPLIAKLNSGGGVIYNLDETGCTTVPPLPRVVAKKGMKQVGQVTSRERGELVTLCGIVSATGVALPPVYVFPRKTLRDVLMQGAPEGSLGLVSESGWMKAEIFVKVLEHLAKFSGCTPEKQIIVVMDNHDSHIALANVLYAKEHGINVVTLPPHTSNKTQPLDVSVYGPHKSFFNAAVNSWMLEHPGKTVTINNMAKLMGEAWLKAATPVNIMSGFRMAGIWPVDRHVFTAEQFMSSAVTDRPVPVSRTPSTSAVNDQPVPVCSGPTPSTSVVPATVRSSLPAHSEISSPATSQTSPAAFVSPQQFRGYPKVK